MPKLADIATLLNVPLPADADPQMRIDGVDALADAGPHDLSYVASEVFARELEGSQAAAVLAQRKVVLPTPPIVPVLLVDDAELAIARVLELFAPPVSRPASGVDPAARVSPGAILGEGVAIGFGAYIGQRTVIGPRSVIHPGTYIGDDVVIGEDCELFPNVVIRQRVTLGNRVVINAGSVIGTDGFGYRWDGVKHAKIPQIGTVVIEDDVELGSCTCIDRAKFGVTRIGRGSKFDNLVQIGHNARIGPHCIIAGQAGLAGTVTLGTGVIMGGQSAVRNHVKIGDGAMLAACAGAIEDIPPKAIVSGLPAFPHRQSLREQAAIRRLPDLVIQVRKLQEKLDALEGK